MNPSPISASEFAERLPKPPEVSAAWDVFSLYVIEPPHQVSAEYSAHILGLVIAGTCRLRCDINGRSEAGWSGPGTINLIPAHVKGTWEGR
jgi:hypothetical protein